MLVHHPVLVDVIDTHADAGPSDNNVAIFSRGHVGYKIYNDSHYIIETSWFLLITQVQHVSLVRHQSTRTAIGMTPKNQA